MDSFATSAQDGYDPRIDPKIAPLPRPQFAPNPSSLVDSYSQDALNGFEKEKPRINPLNQERVQSSVLVDLKDSVQIHLLTETALFDSKEYVILSEDEVDSLKKQVQFLNQRIEQTRSNLTIQSKYRDAAASMTRLYSPTRAEGRRKSLLGNRLSGGSDAAREAEAEREAVQKKCESLAADLWALEQRLMEPQKRLLEHTAGILQHAHKAAKKTATPVKPPLVNGVPASPESMYTTSNGRNSLDFLDDGFLFDEASLYRSFDMTEPLNIPPRSNPLEIPLKSPVREQNKQLTEESEKLRHDNDDLLAELEELRRFQADQWQTINEAEQKLGRCNHQLREVIVKADPARNANYDAAPSGQHEPGDMLHAQLDYLENGLYTIADSQNSSNSSNKSGSDDDATQKIKALNNRIQYIVGSANPSHPPAPATSAGLEEHFAYLDDSISAMDDEMQRALDASRNSSDKQNLEHVETVLTGLWDIIQSGYADHRQRKQERRKAREDNGLEPDDEDLSDGDTIDLNEPYTLQAFSANIQWLYTQATRLMEQKAVLKRQIKQQRELNSRSDHEKDQQLHDKNDELDQARLQLSRAEQETDKARTQLSQALDDLEKLQNMRNDQTEDNRVVEEAREQLSQRNAKVTTLEAEVQNMQARLEVTEASIETITAQLQEAQEARDTAEKEAEEKRHVIRSKDLELENMTGLVAALKTEATMIKAELDGAYGSRKERAAEVAKLHNTSESSKLQMRVTELEQELTSTANDLTDLVKQSLESEKKISELEDQLDRVKADRNRMRDEQEKLHESLETQLHEATSHIESRLEAEISRLKKDKEQIQEDLDKERFRSGTTTPNGATKTSYLTESYRVGLRAERKKYEELLRAEQTQRRKIEDELRALRKAHGPGKSPLSPRP
ncbi:hypothetical protein GGR57DRAFT_463652 [Xylariaceae sp. FL1272]|nr:hypothetical protein GGR57DRAFT_463652 [Xylariaceae sp. FL1272]